MIIGILSDSHGDVQTTMKAARLLQKNGAEVLFHCGDVGLETVLIELATLDIPTHVVLGNIDLYDSAFSGFPNTTSVQLHGRFADMEVDGKRIALLHGDDDRKLKEVVASGDYDYIFRGHTHMREDERFGRTRMINPGALYRAHPHTAATLDLAKDQLHFFTIS